MNVPAIYVAGVTAFDAADHYGPAEKLLGSFVNSRPPTAAPVQLLTKYCVFSGMEMAAVNRESVERVSQQEKGESAGMILRG